MSVIEGLIFLVWIIFGLYYLIKDKHSGKTSLKYWPHVRNLIFGTFLLLSGIAMFIVSSTSYNDQENVMNVIISFFGLYCAITFRHTGREALIQRKKFNEFLRMKLEYTNTDVVISQIGFLLIGTIFFIVGMVKFLISLGLK